jgi:hypothetical protein
VKQPLPLPSGVSNSAVGEAFTSAAEPELALLLVLSAALLGAFALLRARRGAARVAS